MWCNSPKYTPAQTIPGLAYSVGWAVSTTAFGHCLLGRARSGVDARAGSDMNCGHEPGAGVAVKASVMVAGEEEGSTS